MMSKPSLENAGQPMRSAISRFALKFYTEDGNRDIVGNNTPVFSQAWYGARIEAECFKGRLHRGFGQTAFERGITYTDGQS